MTAPMTQTPVPSNSIVCSIKKLRRWISNFAACLSLLLCIAILAMSASGGWHSQRFHTVPMAGRWWYTSAGSSQAKIKPNIQIAIVHAFPAPLTGRFIPPGPTDIFNHFGFSFSHWVEYGPDGTGASQYFGKRWDIRMSYVGAAAGLLFLPITVWLRPPLAAYLRTRRYERLRMRGQCGNCGYDLRATPECCPECGTVPQGSAAAFGKD